MYKYLTIFNFFADAFIKLSLGIIFFNYGIGKASALLNGTADSLVNMVTSMPFLGLFPLFFSWMLALSESTAVFFLIYGLFSFLPFHNIISRITGFVCLIISIIIVYQHIFVWGDNIFPFGPFSFLNVSEEGKPIFGQFLFIPMSFYIVLNSKGYPSKIDESK